jgi:nucleotide-binding universal stress UspA family protein
LLQRERDWASLDAQLVVAPGHRAGRTLHVLAERLRSDLIVVGSTRRGLLGRVMLGDDTLAALDGASCAVAIAPTGYDELPHQIARIGVGYDGSPDSERALALARRLAGELSAHLAALEVVSIPAYLLLGPGVGDRASIDALIRDARGRVASLGDVEPHGAYGDAAEELTLYSASLDLLVVGSRGYGPVGRLVYGAVAQRLARTARCPLLVHTRASRISAAAGGEQDGRATAVSAS